MKDETMNAYAAQLQDMTRNGLYTLAQDAKIPGRSKMTKDQLIEALTIAQAEVLNTQAPEVQDYYTTPAKPTRVKALITRDVPGAAFFNITNGVGGVIVRSSRVFELVTSSGETITVRARTMVKAVKRLAVKLGIHLDAIDTVKVF